MRPSRSLRSLLHLLGLLALICGLLPQSAPAAAHDPTRAAGAGHASTPAARAQGGAPVCRPVGLHQIYMPMVRGSAPAAAAQAAAQATPAARPMASAPAATDGATGLYAAYVHDGDLATADAFRALLGTRGIQVALWPRANMAGGDFSGCDLLIVGADTGAWDDAATRDAAVGAGLPTVALGPGGFSLLSAAGLVDGLPAGSSDATTIAAVSRGRAAFAGPAAIALAADDTVQLYSAPVPARWLSLAAPLPTGAEIGKLPGTSQYPIVQLQSRFVLWGFAGGPAAMTSSGQDLFANLLSFQGENLQVPLRSRSFIPQPGVEQELRDALATAGTGLHAFVQLNDLDNPACTPANLAARGINVLYFFWGQTYIAFVGKGLNSTDPVVNGCVRWMGRILPADRVHPDVVAGSYPDWAENGDGTVKLIARFMPDVAANAAEGILAGLGATFTPAGANRWEIVIGKAQVAALMQQDAVRWLEPGPRPEELLNDDNRALLFVDEVQRATINGGTITYNGLDGSGVTVGVWDSGVDNTHPDLGARVLTTNGQGDHGTHVAGIIGSSGGQSTADGGSPFAFRGMAPNVEFAAYGSNWATSEMAEAIRDYGIEVSNHSYVMTCGDYDDDARRADDLARGDLEEGGSALRPHLVVFAAANQGTAAQYCREYSDDDTTGPRGFYSVLAPAKNVLTVGGVADSTGYALRGSSSRGPTWDGRLKPEIMGIGCAFSTVVNGFIDVRPKGAPDGVDDYSEPYDSMCGTSMAAPSVAGIAALMVQQYYQTYAGISANPPADGLKALLINSATDLVQDPNDPAYSAFPWFDPDMSQPVIYHRGPDFSTGYGVAHARRAVDAVSQKGLLTGSIGSAGDTVEFTINVLAERQELRFTLVWSDPALDPAASNVAPQLVNDLDLVLIDPNGGLHYPWVVDPLPAADDGSGEYPTDGSPDPITQADIQPAYRAADHRNNTEQVVVWKSEVAAANWAGAWTVRVSASALPQGPQPFALAGEWRTITLAGDFPIDAGYNLAPDLLNIPVRVRNPHLSPDAAAGGISAADWRVRVGDAASNSWTDATVEAAYGPVGDQAYLVVRPPSTLSPGILYDLEVTLRDGFQPDQRVAEAPQDIARFTRTDAILFLGEPRPPVDEVIVVDNSGSMAETPKMVSAQNAARAFTDRRQAGDQIGLANFGDSAATVYPLTPVSAGEGELATVKANIDAMLPDKGATALGSGLLEAKGQLDTSGDPAHTKHIVLLSDGLENVPPCWDTGAGNPYCAGAASMREAFVVVDGCPAISVDIVAVGAEGSSWLSLLEDIAEQTCGTAWNATVEGGGTASAGLAASTLDFPQTLQNRLADIYVSIADGNTHQQRLWERAALLGVGEVIVENITLESGLPEATFAINWPDPQPIRVELFRPSGVQVNAGDPDVTFKSDATHRVFRITAPAAGEWVLRVGAATANNGGAEILATVSGNTDVTMLLQPGLPAAQRVVGATMPFYLVLADEGGPITGATAALLVQRPNGSVANLTMYDDGSHGDGAAGDGVYTNRYTIPAAGTYTVKGFAKGTAHDGESFQRHATTQFHVKQRPRVAYILKSDQATADQYGELLKGNGFDIAQIKLEQVAATSFKPYDLIVVGPDTGSKDSWGDDAAVKVLIAARKPVIGLGDGGNAFFGKAGLQIGYANRHEASDETALAVNLAANLWQSPFDLNLPASGKVGIYSSASPGVTVVLSPTQPGIEVLARRADPQFPRHYWLAREQGRYTLWGFNNGPAAMTAAGRALFVNTAWYVMP